MAEAPPTGRLARGAVAGAALARAGLSQLGHKAAQGLGLAGPQAQAEQEARLGRILFCALNQLKGVGLKAAQLLSMEAGLLPEGVREQLAQAQYRATPLNRALVRKLLREEFGQGPETLFAAFEPEAFAAASLGQVHGALGADGRRLAVKLQYPGMAATVRSDMLLLRALLGGLGGLPDPELLARTLAQIEQALLQELDYRLEAEQLAWFAARLPEQDFVLPRALPALSSARVLTMARLAGLHLPDWLAGGPSQAERDRQGQVLLDLFMTSAFELRRLQADPQPGNYLFMPDGRLGLLDFGCTRTLAPDFAESLRQTWRARLRGDDAGLLDAYIALGLVAPELGLAEFRSQVLPALAPLLDWLLLPWRTPRYDFGQHPPMPRMPAAQHRLAMHYLKDMPAEQPFFDRSLLGLIHLLSRLRAQVNTHQDWI